MFQMLLVDDDDADLSNGTPHFDAIIRNFSKHGIGDFNVSISAPKIPDYENPGPTIDVTLSVFSLGVDATELALYADLDGSGFTRIDVGDRGAARVPRVDSQPAGRNPRSLLLGGGRYRGQHRPTARRRASRPTLSMSGRT
ncbi:MAG: hypothetical protein R3E12_13550 [Candidatus Eisenbacteria bacterium]